MTTLLLVDDEPSVLTALRACLALESDLEIVGEAADGETALSLAAALHPDIVVTDVRMPHGDGIAVVAALQSLAVPPSVVILTIYDDPTTRARARAAGAAAFVGKHEPADALLVAIQRVVRERRAAT